MTKTDKKSIISSLLAVLMLLISSNTFSQSAKVPPFQMILANGRLFKAQDLPIGKPIIIIYFSPECVECQKVTEELIARIDDYWKASIAMVTYLPVTAVSQYVSKYKLNIYPNIFVGTEGNSFFLRNYYNIQEFPLIALYSKDGDLIKLYKTEDNLIDLTLRIKGL